MNQPIEMSNEEWLILLNSIISFSTGDAIQCVYLDNLAQGFDQVGLDSLDVFIIQTYVVDIFAIPHSFSDNFYPETALQVIEFVARHGERKFANAAQALALLSKESPHV